MSYLLFGAIDQINVDLQRLSVAITGLQNLGFCDDHPAVITLREKIAKLQAELKGLEENI